MTQRTKARFIFDMGDRESLAPEAVQLYCPGLYGLAAAAAVVAVLLPIHDANGQLAVAALETREGPENLYACVLAVDPFRKIGDLVRNLGRAGFAGVANFPTVTVIDGAMRATLDDSGLGFERELELIRLARELQLGTVGFVACADEARAMIMAGAQSLALPPGLPVVEEVVQLCDKHGVPFLDVHPAPADVAAGI